MSKQSKAIVIYKKSDLTGSKYPACSKCHNAVFVMRMTPTSVEMACFKDAEYCPWCGSKFIKRGINNV